MMAFRLFILCAALMLPCPLVSADDADEAKELSPPEKPTEKSGKSIADILPRQPADEELEPFVPKTPASGDQKSSAEALSWFMAGQLKEGRDDFDGAGEAYRKAIEANPAGLPAYQALVSISFAQPSKHEDAKTYAIRAAEHAEGGIDLVRGLAALFVRENSSKEAVALLTQALQKTSESASKLNTMLMHRDLGLFSQMAGDNKTALENYRVVFDTLQDEQTLSMEEREQLLGDAGATYEQMGKVFLESKLPDLAVASFEEASKFNQGRPGVHSFNLATVYKETGEPQKALDELQKYFNAQLQTKGRAAYQLLKELLAETDQSDTLLPKLEAMHDNDDRNISLAYFLAEQYQEAGDLDEAEELLNQTIGDGADPRGLVGLAMVYRQKGNAEKLYDVLRKGYQVVPQPDDDETELLERMDADMRAVVEQFKSVQEAVAGDDSLVEKVFQIGRDRKQADNGTFEFLDAFMLGKLAATGEHIDQAKEFYLLAIDMQNDPPPALYRELGLILNDAERYGEAAEVFQAALTHTSTRLQSSGIQSFFQYLRSHALEMDGQTDAALEAIREARNAQPDNAGLHFQEAWIHYHAHQYDEAIAEFEKVIETYGSSDDDSTRQTVKNSRYSLSAIYVQRGDEVKGEEILLEVYRVDPDDTQVNNDLGYLWADQGRKLEDAKAMIQKALDAEPENAAYLDSMGWVLYKLGEYEASREHLERAAALPRGEDSTIYDHLGDALEKLDEHDKAVEAWKKALELEEAEDHPDEKIVNRVKAKLPSAE